MTERVQPVALVTGAGRGLGEAIVRALHQGRYTVAVTDIDEGAATSVAQSLSGDGSTARAYQLDVSSAQQVADVFASVARDLGMPTLSSTMRAFIRVTPFSICLKPHGIAFSTST